MNAQLKYMSPKPDQIANCIIKKQNQRSIAPTLVSDSQTVRQSDSQTIRQSDSQTVSVIQLASQRAN